MHTAYTAQPFMNPTRNAWSTRLTNLSMLALMPVTRICNAISSTVTSGSPHTLSLGAIGASLKSVEIGNETAYKKVSQVEIIDHTTVVFSGRQSSVLTSLNPSSESVTLITW